MLFRSIKGAGFATVAKRLDFLSEEKTYTIDEVIEHCENSNSTLKFFSNVIEGRELVEHNYKMMQLYSPQMSIQAKTITKEAIENFEFTFNKTELIKMMNIDGFSDLNLSDLTAHMKEKYQKLPLRSGVGIVVLNKENKIFVAKRIDNPKNFWQMPQGGVDKNEDFYSAALRELNEETSIVSVKLIKVIENRFTYILPDNLIGIIWKGKFKGQRLKWFVMRFFGNDSEINIKTKNPEFLEWKWIRPNKLTSVVVKFKLNVYEQISKKIEEILN